MAGSTLSSATPPESDFNRVDDSALGLPLAVQSVAVRRGVHMDLPIELEWWERNIAVHMARLRDSSEKTHDGIAVLHSAALLHGAWLKRVPDQAHMHLPWKRKTRAYTGRTLSQLARSDRQERLAQRPVVSHDMGIDVTMLVTIDGIMTTDIEQTILMCARFLPADEAWCAVESLVSIAIGRDSRWRSRRSELVAEHAVLIRRLLARLGEFKGQRGAAQAHVILLHCSPFSESVWESEARRIALAFGYLAVEPQVEVRTRAGTKWVDLGVPSLRRGIEVNGFVKYDGEDGESTREKELVRKDDLTAVHFRIDDVTPAQIRDVHGFLAMLDSAFGESRSRTCLTALRTHAERSGRY